MNILTDSIDFVQVKKEEMKEKYLEFSFENIGNYYIVRPPKDFGKSTQWYPRFTAFLNPNKGIIAEFKPEDFYLSEEEVRIAEINHEGN